MIPTLPTLASLCRCWFGLGCFFSDAAKHSLSITRNLREHQCGKTQETVKQLQLGLGADSSIVAREVDFRPGVDGVLTDVGKGFIGVIYVLEGSLQIDSAGLQDVLEAGGAFARIAKC